MKGWSAKRWGLRSLAAALGATALWFLVAWVMSSDRAIGFRDEGLYLLAADPPTSTAAWVTPFGWGTAPFFQLVGYDIAHLRTLAVWLLTMVGGALGWVMGRWATAHDGERTERWTAFGAAAVGALGAPMLFASLLRTPGYNWVNLLGLCIAAGGAVAARGVQAATLWRDPRSHLAAALVAFGTCFAVPAKPSSAPLMLVAIAALVAPHLRRRTLPFAALAAGWGALWSALAVATRLWPANFLSTLWRAAKFPPLHENQTMGGAFHDLLRTPKVAVQELQHLRPAAIAIVVAAALLAALLHRSTTASSWIRAVPFALVALAAVGTAVPWPVLGGDSPAYRFAWTGTANAAVLLMVGALLHLWTNWSQTAANERRRTLGMGIFLVALAMTFAFGSAMGIYHQMGLAALLLWLAVTVVVSAAGDTTARRAAVAMTVLAAFAMVTSNIVDSRHRPFDAAEITTQTTPVMLGAHDRSLLLDTATAEFVQRLTTEVRAAGFCNGTKLIGMAWNWSATVSYAVGAEVPDELMLTLFGYDNAPAVLDFTMPYISGPAWHDAWVLTTAPDTIEPNAAAELDAALARLPAAVGRTFPDDYTLAVDVDGTQFWHPTDLDTGSCTGG